MTMSKAKVAAIIRKAANQLEAQETIPQWKVGEPGCYCAGACIGDVLRGAGLATLPSGNFYAVPFNYYRSTRDVWEACGGMELARFNDNHTKDETVAHMRSIADRLDPPKVVTVADLMPKTGPFAECATADETEMTPKAFRRRLLAWEQLLRTDWVVEHWNYGQFMAFADCADRIENGESTYVDDGAIPSLEEPAAHGCNTAGCAAGWSYLIPEAARAGCGKRGLWPDGDFQSQSRAAAKFFGLHIDCDGTAPEYSSDSAYYAITMGNDLGPWGCPIKLSLDKSKPGDVADAIRWFADRLYPEQVEPVTANEAPVTSGVTIKPKRVEKLNTKRGVAKMLRDGARFLDTHHHTSGMLYAEDKTMGPCYCAVGAMAAANGVEPGPLGSMDFSGLLCPGLYWSDVLGRIIDADTLARVEAAVLGGPPRSARFLQYANDNYAALRTIPGTRVSTPEAKATIQKFMRTLAYALEHGGKLPPGLAKAGKAGSQ